MQTRRKFYWAFFLAGIADILILDLVTKLLVVYGIIGEFVFIKDFFYITSLQKNEGIAFGIDLPMWLQIVGSLAILLILLKMGFEYFFAKEKFSLFSHWLFGAVIGGGLGNLIDRLIHGYVIDFIVLKPFPVFNVADIGITVGLVALFATIWLSSRGSATKI